jgi:SagB-type dehydrogenase family enzyme
MSLGYVLSFAKGITVTTPAADLAVIQMPVTYKKHSFKDLSPGLRQAIELLNSTGATEEELVRQVEETDGASTLARLYYYLLLFAERRLLSYSITGGGRRLATLAPASAAFSFSPAPIDPQARYALSRFAYLRREQNELVLESPLAHGKMTMHGWEGTAVAAVLAEPHSLASLADMLPGVPGPTVSLFLEMLLGGGFASELKAEEPYPGQNETLAQWDFHDLLFHARSRSGRHANPCGGTYRFRDKIQPLPAVKQLEAEETIDLYRPDIDKLALEDYPFTLVLEERSSIRKYAERPLTDRQLGEFLYRAARVKKLLRTDYQDLSSRPYPAGGAIYELELYLSIHACENIPSGLYHYCPEKHRLEKISSPTETGDALLKAAKGSAGLEELPQVLITIAARFQRLSWKYENIAYSLLLKNTGALYQTMYLVATAMELAPCGLGGGDSDLFARAAGLDYYGETSVGEFLIGSKRI